MKVQFVCDCEIEVIERRMIAGELQDAIGMVNVQFGDGSVAFGLCCEWFKAIE